MAAMNNNKTPPVQHSTINQQPSQKQTNTTQAIHPLQGLGGGITEADKKVLKLESEMSLIKQTIASNSLTVTQMETQVKNQISMLEDKIENTTSTIMTQMEQKILENNIEIETKMSNVIED
jgi:hypothetical protein